MGKIIGLIFAQEAAAPAATPDVFTCPVCGKEYKTEDGLEKHMKKEHPEAAEPAPEK